MRKKTRDEIITVGQEALDQRQAEIDALRAELAQMREAQQALIGAIQRFQPAGSPPPGGEVMLAEWVLSSLHERLTRVETAWETAVDMYPDLERFLPDEEGR